MALLPGKFDPWLQQLRRSWQIARFGVGILVGRSPALPLAVLLIGVLVGLIPLAQIQATAGLVNAMASRVGDASLTASDTDGGLATLVVALRPYWPWLVLLLAAMALGNLGNSLRPYLATSLSEQVSRQLDLAFFNKAMSIPLERFDSSQHYDTLQRARGATGGNLVNCLDAAQGLVSAAIGAGGILVALSVIHWAVPLLLLAGGMALVRWNVSISREFNRINYEQAPVQRRLGYWRSLLTDRSAAAEVRLFDLSDHLVGRWRVLCRSMLAEIADARHRHIRRAVPVTALSALLYSFAAAFVLYAGAREAASPGTVVALLYGIEQYRYLAQGIAFRTGALQSLGVVLSYLWEFLSSDEEPRRGKAAPAAVMSAGVRFENVSFTYPGSDRPAVSSVTLSIRSGDRIALIGENGAGKSTLVKLLAGLYMPTSGRITVDGVDLRDIDPSIWRAQVSVVLQDFTRYPLTARENIGIGQLSHLNDLDAITRAARLSSAHEVIQALPRQYETVLAKEFEGGGDLSLGEWQKVAIARAYLRDAPLVVLDEPASSLDPLAELEVHRQFGAVSRGKTVVLISHRLGPARFADRILFLRDGQLVEEGEHSTLMDRDGSYARLYRMQAEWYQNSEISEASFPNA